MGKEHFTITEKHPYHGVNDTVAYSPICPLCREAHGAKTVPPVRAFVTELVNEGWAIVPKELLEPVLSTTPLPDPRSYVFTVWPNAETGDYLVSHVRFPGGIK